MKKKRAFLIGLALSPLIPATISSAMTSKIGVTGIDVISMLGWIPIAYLFTLAAELLFGLPLVLILWRLDLIRWWSAALGGVFAAVCFSILIRMPNPIHIQDAFVPANMLMGSVSAICFWVCWRLGSEEDSRDGLTLDVRSQA